MKATVIFKKQSIPANHFVVSNGWGESYTNFICEHLIKKLARYLPDNAHEMKVEITIESEVIQSLDGEKDGKISNDF